MIQALSIPLFKKHFLGFLFSDALSLPKQEHEYLDFYVINTNHVFGEHWFACIRGKTKWIIFDCSVFTPKKYHDALKKILSRETPHVVLDCSHLQETTSLSCGSHVISFLYFFVRKMGKSAFYPPNYYFNKLLKFCKIHKISPDTFVRYLVYDSGVFGIKPESSRRVKTWLNSFK